MKFVSKLQKGQTAGGQASRTIVYKYNTIYTIARFFSPKNSIKMIVFEMMATKICLTGGQVGDARCIS